MQSTKQNKWNTLSIKQKAELIRIFVKHGIYDLQQIKDTYNNFDSTETDTQPEYVDTYSNGGNLLFAGGKNNGKGDNLPQLSTYTPKNYSYLFSRDYQLQQEAEQIQKQQDNTRFVKPKVNARQEIEAKVETAKQNQPVFNEVSDYEQAQRDRINTQRNLQQQMDILDPLRLSRGWGDISLYPATEMVYSTASDWFDIANGEKDLNLGTIGKTALALPIVASGFVANPITTAKDIFSMGKMGVDAAKTVGGAAKEISKAYKYRGFWGNNALTRTFGTYARNNNIRHSAHIPQLLRTTDILPSPNSFYNPENLLSNTSTSNFFTGHGNYHPKSHDVGFIINGKSINPKNIISIEPSDTFFKNPISINPKDVIVITGNPQHYEEALKYGYRVPYFPDLFNEHSKILTEFNKHKNDRFNMVKLDFSNSYRKLMNEKMKLFGTPDIEDYYLFSKQTDLPNNVFPLKNQKEVAIDLLNGVKSPFNPDVEKPFITKYINDDGINLEKMRYVFNTDYDKVYYNPVSTIESDAMGLIGLEPHPQINLGNSINFKDLKEKIKTLYKK